MDILQEALTEQTTPESEGEQTQVQAPPETPEVTGEQSATPAPQETPEKKPEDGIAAGIVAERRKRQEAEARAAALEQRFAELQRQQAPPSKVTEDGPPDPNAFQDNPQEYWRLLARYEARQELKEVERAREEGQKRQADEQRQQAFLRAAAASVEAGRSEFPDFDAAINNGLAPFMTPVMQQALIHTQGGHKVAYYLSKNPAEASRISQLDPMSMLMALGEARVKAATPEKPAIPQTLTQARDARGQFSGQPGGPTPLAAILDRK